MPAALSTFSSTTPLPTATSVTVLHDFAALRAAAPGLTDDAGEDFFYSLDWFEILHAHGFDADARLELWLSQTLGQPPLCLPLIDGPALNGLSNFYSALFGPIGKVEAGENLTAIARRLCQDPRRWPWIRLQPLDQDGAFFRAFSRELRAAAYWVDHFDCFGNWTLLLAGRSYSQYLESLPSRLQNTIRRARRKLERSGELDITIHQAAGPLLEQAIGDFETIYAASWKTPEPFPRFISAWCQRAAERGWLRLGVLRLDGQALAAQLWLVKDGKASIFKLAYREGSQPFSPGSVLTAELMRQVIDQDGVAEVDFLCGDDPYKQDWMSHRRERVGLIAFRLDHWRGLFAAARHLLGKLRRRWRGS